MSLRKQLDERDAFIQFLREEYAKAMGQDLNVPPRWEGIAGLPMAPLVPGVQTVRLPPQTFTQTLTTLNLPKPQVKKGKREGRKKTLQESSVLESVNDIKLSDFKDQVSARQGVSREELQTLLHTGKELPRLYLLELRNNGLGDVIAKDLEELRNYKRLRRLDLSGNALGKAAVMQVIELLKGESVLDWLDLAFNAYGSDSTAVLSLSSAVKACPSLCHLRVSISEACDQFVRNALANKHLTSLGFPGSKLPPTAFALLSQNLGDRKVTSHLAALDFSSCFMQKPALAQLMEALKYNRSLTKLDLSGNGLSSEVGALITDALDFNFSLTVLKLGNNELGDTFAKALARTLKNNQTLWECDLAANPVTDEGAVAIQAVLACENSTLVRLGSLEDSHGVSVLVREQLQSLLVARAGGQVNTALLVSNEYPLLRSVEASNAGSEPQWQPWNLLGSVLY